jgi:ParB family chromosome partitioning protein
MVPIAKIVRSPARRKTVPARVKALADSILEIGLQHPIGLTLDYRLVHGAHRIDALLSLGRNEVAAVLHDLDTLHAELAEIDENIQRAGLSKIQEAKSLKRRKQIYEAMHPEAPKGQGRPKKNGDNLSSFSEDAASKSGRNKRSIQRDVALADAIPDDVAERIADSPVADNKSELKQLAKMPEAEQRKAAEKIAAGAGSVREAVTGKKKQKRRVKKPARAPAPSLDAADDIAQDFSWRMTEALKSAIREFNPPAALVRVWLENQLTQF